MVDIDKARVVSYENKGLTFEIYVDADLALAVRGGEKDLDHVYGDLLAVEEVYKDAKKGDKVGPKALLDEFGTSELKEIVEQILHKGRLDLTTEQKRKVLESKKKEVVAYIVKNAINPIIKAPLTVSSVEAALEKSRVDIDINKKIEKQIDAIIEKLKPILPMSFHVDVYRVFVPVANAGKVQGVITKYEVIDRKWDAEYFVCTVKVPAGLKDGFLSTISGLTQGKARIEIENES